MSTDFPDRSPEWARAESARAEPYSAILDNPSASVEEIEELEKVDQVQHPNYSLGHVFHRVTRDIGLAFFATCNPAWSLWELEDLARVTMIRRLSVYAARNELFSLLSTRRAAAGSNSSVRDHLLNGPDHKSPLLVLLCNEAYKNLDLWPPGPAKSLAIDALEGCMIAALSPEQNFPDHVKQLAERSRVLVLTHAGLNSQGLRAAWALLRLTLVTAEIVNFNRVDKNDAVVCLEQLIHARSSDTVASSTDPKEITAYRELWVDLISSLTRMMENRNLAGELLRDVLIPKLKYYRQYSSTHDSPLTQG